MDYVGKILKEMERHELLKPPLPTYTAVAYDWYYPEWGKPQEITLVVRWNRVIKEGEEYKFQPPLKEKKEYEYKILLSGQRSQKSRGASEPIGLLPKTFSYDVDVQGIFERNIADILIAILYRDILPMGEKYILFQGPFLPKMIGRLGYRHIKKEVTIGALTFKNEWLPREPLLANTKLNEHFKRRFFKLLDKHAKYYQLADFQSPNGVSEVLKSWGLKKENEVSYLIELFCQFPCGEQSNNTLWINKLEQTQQVLSSLGLIFQEGEATYLPFSLATAYDYCKHHGKRPTKGMMELYKDRESYNYLYYYEEDIGEMAKRGFTWPEIIGRRTLLYEGIDEDKKEIFEGIKKNLKNIDKLREIYQEHETQFEGASAPDRRGNVLSGFLRKARGSGLWGVELWRKLV